MDKRLYRSLLIPALIFIIAVSARIIPGPRTIDDAYITYRYAQNILGGNGFVFNPGERVLGTTTPVYTLSMVSIGLLSGGRDTNFPQIAYILNAVIGGFECILLYYLGLHFGSKLAAIGATLVWSIAPYSVTFAVGGLETSLYVLLLTATITSYLTRRYTLTALLAAISILTRPDALLLILPLIVDRIWQQVIFIKDLDNSSKSTWDNRIILSGNTFLYEIVAFLTPLLIWGGFSYFYFGSPVPHSITAKSVAYLLPSNAGFIRLLQHYATPFLGHRTFGNQWIGIGFVIYLFSFIIGARHAIKVDKRSWPYIIYPWLYFFTYAIANPLIFRWYLTPVLAPYILIILIGIDKLIGDIWHFLPIKNKSFQHIKQGLAVTIIIIIPTILSLRDWQMVPDHGMKRPAPSMAWYKLELLYEQAADYIEPALVDTPNAILAAGDVGMLGYKTQAMVLDTVGLNTPISSSYYPADPDIYVTNYAIPSELILEQKPDYIVILEVYGRGGLIGNPQFQIEYEQIKKIPTDIYGSDGMLIFRNISGDSTDKPIDKKDSILIPETTCTLKNQIKLALH